jgi:hypothetical protein
MTTRPTKQHPNKVNPAVAIDPERAKRDLERVASNTKARLHSLGVPTSDDDAPDDLIRMLEAIERFENVVRSQGGDLMVDEAPPGSRPQPDGKDRALPARAAGEPAGLYVERLDRAAELASVRAQ